MTPEQREYEEFMRTPRPGTVLGALGGLAVCCLMVVAYVVGGVVILVAVGAALAAFLDVTGISPALVHGTLLLSAAIVIVAGGWMHANGARPARRLYRASDDIDGPS
jgi:amino acid transporter